MFCRTSDGCVLILGTCNLGGSFSRHGRSGSSAYRVQHMPEGVRRAVVIEAIDRQAGRRVFRTGRQKGPYPAPARVESAANRRRGSSAKETGLCPTTRMGTADVLRKAERDEESATLGFLADSLGIRVRSSQRIGFRRRVRNDWRRTLCATFH
jgi:hypothetical protein